MKTIAKQTCSYIIEGISFLYKLIILNSIFFVGDIYSAIGDMIKWHYTNAIYIPAKISEMKHTDLVTTEDKVRNFFSMSTKSHLILWISGVLVIFTTLVGIPVAFHTGYELTVYARNNVFVQPPVIELTVDEVNPSDSTLNDVEYVEGSTISTGEVINQEIQQEETLINSVYVVVAKSGLNERSTPSLEELDNKVDVINFGDEVVVEYFINYEWARLSNGNYVHREYIEPK